MVIKDGIRVSKGTPTAPIARPTLLLRVWRLAGRPADDSCAMASLHVVRPGRAGYVVKELLAATALAPGAALAQAIAIARRGDVADIYVNADVAKIPPLYAAAG